MKTIIFKLIQIPRSFWSLLLRIHKEPGSRKVAFAWSLAFIFFGFSILTESNPFKLLIPGLSYPIPVLDQRDDIFMYGVDRHTGESFPITRRVMVSDDPITLVQRLAFTLSATPNLAERNAGADYMKLEPLPNLGVAFRKIWFHDMKGHSTAIIDIRKETLDDVLRDFLVERGGNKDRLYYLDSFFRSLTYSILTATPEAQQVHYTIDGETDQIKGMKFRLNRTYSRRDLP